MLDPGTWATWPEMYCAKICPLCGALVAVGGDYPQVHINWHEDEE